MASLRNRRIQILGLLSAPSGLPLGFVTNTLQVFLRSAGVSLKTIGLLQVISVPWTLKFLWAPLLDRYALRWPDRRRSWVLLTQLALADPWAHWPCTRRALSPRAPTGSPSWPPERPW